MIGVERAKEVAADADLIIYVVDSSVPLDKNDREIMNLIKGKKVIVLLNKSDLNNVVDESIIVSHLYKSVDIIDNEEYSDFNNNIYNVKFNKIDDNVKLIKTSTKENFGIEELEETIKDMFLLGELKMNDEVMLTNLRQKDAVKDALDSLLMVKRSLEDNMPEDFLSIDLMGAYSSLGYVIGEEIGEDVVNEIFSKFCMGK